MKKIDGTVKGKPKKRYRDHLWIILFFAAFVSFSITSSNDKLSIVLNIIILFIMLGFLLHGMGFLFNKNSGSRYLFACTTDLKNLTHSLVKFDEEFPGLAWEQLREQDDYKFECTALKESIEQFNLESDALYEDDDSYQCDIAEYINENLIFAVGNAPFNDFVSNAMTGLGILGTFIGLAIGLKSFDASTAEAMTNSIVPLIDGIKVAFYTSIFGVGFSLIYGTLYRRLLNDAKSALDEFMETYYRCRGRKPNNDAMAKMLSYQQSQTYSLDQFAEQISVALGDVLEKCLSPTLNALPDQISQSMQACLEPTMKSMEENLTGITSDLSEKLSDAQEEGVGNLIERFMTCMNESMDGQIENLGETIKAICDWQKDTIEHLNDAVASMRNNYANLNEINDCLAHSIERLEDLLNKISEAENSHNLTAEKTSQTLLTAAENMESSSERIVKLSDYSNEVISAINDMSTLISAQAGKMNELVEAQISSLSEISEASRNHADSLKNSESALIVDFKHASEQMLSSAENLNDQWTRVLERSFSQFDSELAKALQHFSGTLTDLQEIVENTPAVVDGASTKLQKESSLYLNTISDYQKSLIKTVSTSISDIEDQIKGIKLIVEKNSTVEKNIES